MYSRLKLKTALPTKQFFVSGPFIFVKQILYKTNQEFKPCLYNTCLVDAVLFYRKHFCLTFFPPCFSTMSVLSGKWSSWGVLEPPPLGIVQLSPRQASFTLPLHRHQPSGTKKDKKEMGVSTWPLGFIENTFTHCQTMQPLAVHQALYFQPLQPCSGGRAFEERELQL